MGCLRGRKSNRWPEKYVVSNLKCPVFLASEMSDFGLTNSNTYPAVGAVGMWESQAAFWPDFSKPRREATAFVAFRGGVISTASSL
jgi:hypothetical protein